MARASPSKAKKKAAAAKKKAQQPKKPAPAAAAALKKAPPQAAANASLVSGTPVRSHVASPANSLTNPPVTMVAVPTAQSTQGSLTLFGTPASVNYTNLLMRGNDASDMKQVVRDYVTQHFFKYVKFVASMSRLAYRDPATHPQSYCAKVIKGCNLPKGTDTVAWWESIAKHEVRKKVTQMRSDRITALKWEYYCKFYRPRSRL
jgi:hypothetical protein